MSSGTSQFGAGVGRPGILCHWRLGAAVEPPASAANDDDYLPGRHWHDARGYPAPQHSGGQFDFAVWHLTVFQVRGRCRTGVGTAPGD